MLLCACESDLARLKIGKDSGEIKSDTAIQEIQSDDRDQHQNGARHGVEKKFDGSINSPLTAPDPNQKAHGYQHGFPEYVEEEEIQRYKHSEHSRLQQEHEHKILLHSALNGIPRRQDGKRSEKSGE